MFDTSPVIKCFIFWREKQLAISETYGKKRACALRIDLKFEMVYHPECTKRLIICIIRTVMEAYESHRLLADLRRQNGMVKTRFFLSICFFLIPSVVINNKDLLKTQLIFNFYAHISCKNDWNNFLLLNTNGPLN